MGLRIGEAELWDATLDMVTPRPRLTSLAFGDEHRVYSKEGRSSRWRSSETPWAPEILWALSEESPFGRVPCPKGTQLGFTELGLIWIGQGIAENQSALVIEPTDATAKKVVKTKFRPMLLSTTLLKSVFVGRSADSTLHFSAPGCDVMFAGSNSPANFATVTVPRAFGDEIDRWSPELMDEGDPVDLLENRIAEYGFLGKMFLPCSPTVEGASLVWREWLQSDMRVFEVPCPGCRLPQQWLWENMVWDAGDPQSAKLKCIGCDKAFAEHLWKGANWQAGRWRATNLNPVRKDSAGFHLSSLYARLGQRTWAQIVQRYEAAMASGVAARLQTFWNTILGLPWKVSEETVAVETLRARLEEWERGLCPLGVLLLVCGVDYQDNRVEAFIWGYGPLRERWLVERVVIQRLNPNGTKRPAADVQAELREQVLDRVFPHALGGTLKVEMTVHDANNRPADVFDIIDGLPSRRNVATNGDEGWGRVNRFEPPKIVDVKRDGKVVKTGRKLMRIHTAEAKRDWFDDLARAPNGEDAPAERVVHLPAWVDEEEGLLDQFVAEEIRKTTRGKPYWHKTGRNEGLDCAVMAAAAAWQLKSHRWKAAEWSARARRVATDQPPPGPAPTTTPSAPAPRTPTGRRIRGRFR